MPGSATLSARFVATCALAQAAERFPHLKPTTLDTTQLSPRDARLALVIYRTTMQRWLSLEFLIDLYLKGPLRRLEPALQAVLLSGAAQILFLDRLPARAVVHEAVNLAQSMVRPGAKGLVNAVLRRLAELVRPAVHAQPWRPSPDCLPLEDGYVPLADPCLPGIDQLDIHLSISTSHPVKLVQAWVETFGSEQATALCRHSVKNPPTIVAVETDFPQTVGSAERLFTTHARDGFVLWHGTREQLQLFLSGHTDRRVQDPTMALALHSTQDLLPELIIDWCAGRGTKTRQLAALHGAATIVATETVPDRRADLRQATGTIENVHVVEPAQVARDLGGRRADMIVLDVPCTNTAVLARRPEARYRYCRTALKAMSTLQRQIIKAAVAHLAPHGAILYTTCSLQASENQEQSQWMLEHLGMRLEHESLILPGGSATTYRDGGYFARLQRLSPMRCESTRATQRGNDE